FCCKKRANVSNDLIKGQLLNFLISVLLYTPHTLDHNMQYTPTVWWSGKQSRIPIVSVYANEQGGGSHTKNDHQKKKKTEKIQKRSTIEMLKASNKRVSGSISTSGKYPCE